MFVGGSFKQVKYQILATVIANIVVFGQGCNMGWLSSTLPLLLSNETPLTGGPLTQNEMGWIGSFISIGAIVGTIIYGTLANYIGYKKSLLLSSMPLVLSWILIIIAENPIYICWSRLLVGIGAGGGFVCIPQFVAEIANDFIRGQLNSYLQVSCYFGVLCGFIGGAYLSYELNPLVMITLPVIFFGLFVFMPETPQHLLRTNRFEDAEQSLRFYRNCPMRKNYTGLSKNMIDQYNDQEKQFLTELAKLKAIAIQNELSPKLQFRDFCTREACKAFIMSPTLFFVSQFSGSFILSTYATTIFNSSGSTIDPHLSAVIMGSVQVCGTFSAAKLMDKLGRRILFAISCSGATICLLITAAFVWCVRNGYDVSALNALPVISFSVFIFVCAIGLITVPYVIMGELLPQKIRRVGATICTCTSFLFQFIVLKIFPILEPLIDLYGCMIIFAIVTSFGLLLTIFVIKETSGKNLDVLTEVKENKEKEQV